MTKSIPLQCVTTHRLLARIEGEYLFLWCKTCRFEHRVPMRSFLFLMDNAALYALLKRREKGEDAPPSTIFSVL